MMMKSKRTLTPKMRFPEFRDNTGWEQKPLGDLTDRITDRVGDSVCVPYTITSGEGLFSQEEKYGRIIAGKSLKNYYQLKRNDFAFNKSATKSFPQGYIARLQGDERAAVPNSIFTCFRIANESVDAAYLDYLFQGNLHGRWLKDYITIGARAHGALNISDDDLFAMPIPMPAGDETITEQQKIAECLGSLDDVIAAERRKLESLRDHKCGLMQQFFPQPDQTQPQLRFPEFRNRPGWEEKRLSEVCRVTQGGTPDTSNDEYWNGTINWLTPAEMGKNHSSFIDSTVRKVTESGLKNCSSELLPVHSVIMSTRAPIGHLAINTRPTAINQGCRGMIPNTNMNYAFLYFSLVRAKPRLIDLGAGNTFKELSGTSLKRFVIPIPSASEQQKIADFLASLDDNITAQAEKIEFLKLHKRGLIQNLFLSPEEQ